jgi:LacI family transcriptional regulator
MGQLCFVGRARRDAEGDQELDYVPNATAKFLVISRRPAAGVLVECLAHP